MRTFFIIFGWLLLLFSATSFADDPSDKPRAEHTVKFSARGLVPLVIAPQTYNVRLIHPEDLYVTESSYPWLYPHLVPERGLPKPLAVNKWVQPISIAFGMPNDLEPFEEITKEGKKPHSISGKKRIFLDRTREGKWNGLYYELNDPIADIKGYHSFPAAEAEVQAFSEVVSPVIGLSVSYLSPDEERKEHYGNVRINLFKDDTLAAIEWGNGYHPGLFKRENRPKPKFNTVVTGIGAPPWYDFQQLEPLLNTRISFNNFPRHVEGYFLSNEKNEIQMAVCYIWEGHQPEVLRGLIRECLLRSMGLPGLANRGSDQVSLLRDWNTIKLKPAYSGYLQKPFVLSEVDRGFLELLYSSEIQEGMDYLSLREILKKKNKK